MPSQYFDIYMIPLILNIPAHKQDSKQSYLSILFAGIRMVSDVRMDFG